MIKNNRATSSLTEQQDSKFVIKTYTKSQLRDYYKVSRETFNKWLKKIESELPHYDKNDKTLTPAQVQIIVEAFGEAVND